MMLQRVVGFAGVLLVLASASTLGARVSDVRNTKHNLSTTTFSAGITDTRTVKSTTEDEMCVFCHTPHAAEAIPKAPLWNRKLSGALYTLYGSGSMDAMDLAQPTDGSSKLCLTCHDGTQAIGAVNVLNGQLTDQNPATDELSVAGTGAGGVIPAGSGVTTGNTRNLGTNLTNDHPIAFTYSSALADEDGDVLDPAATTYIKNPSSGVRPDLPLVDNKIECITCHDPHIRDTSGTDIKFLRLNRFQTNTNPNGVAFNKTNDIICLGCHYKQGWSQSAHANPAVADEIYTNAKATERGFPLGIRVWEAACLNCHDPHTVQGAKRLLRDGNDSTTTPKAAGNQAEEEVCFPCHSNDGGALTTQGYGTQVPDIKSDWSSPNKHMPIRNSETAQLDPTSEVHDIGANPDVPTHRGADNVETRQNLGYGNDSNRHVECTDCHHNHRMIRNRSIVSDPTTPDAGGTHNHDQDNTRHHTNIASGVLRGSFGVEPVYSGAAFGTLPSSFLVKHGVPPVNDTLLENASDAPTKTYVSREYQICMKCHSNYAYITPPALGATCSSCTPSLTNGSGDGKPSGMSRYTNQAMEFQAPATHMGEVAKNLGTDAGANPLFNNENHRSWHPVMRPTGRTKSERKLTSMVAFLTPWGDNFTRPAVGYQTMFCSDCHGRKSIPRSSWPDNPTGVATAAASENGRAWGAHGSEFNFILKGTWDDQTGGSGSTDDLCFKCHNYQVYANPNSGSYDGNGYTGFSGGGQGNLHKYHLDKAQGGTLRCTWCHVAVPHGWKNKALLVNLNDVNPAETERDPASDNYVVSGVTRVVAKPYNGTYEISQKEWKNAPANPYKGVYIGYYNPPYYNGAAMKFKQFAASGTWQASDCGSKNNIDGNSDSVDWMKTTCRNLP